MSYQHIRGAIEMATASALVDAGIDKVFFDNVSYAAPDAETSYAEIVISFATVKQDVIGCKGVDDFGGVATVYINTPSGTGARAGEAFALAVAQVWTNSAAFDGFLGDPGHVRMRNIDGPRLIQKESMQGHDSSMPWLLHALTAEFRGHIGDIQTGIDPIDPDTMNTRDVMLTNPITFANVDTTVVDPPGPSQTQEDANQWFAEAIDKLDEAVENIETPEQIDGGDY